MRRRRLVAAAGIAAVMSGSMIVVDTVGGAAPRATAATTCNALQQLLGQCTPDPTPTPTATTPTPTPTETSPAPAGDCGGTTLTKPDGSAWVCSFDDEFDGTSLNRSAWVPQVTSGSNFTTGKAPYRVCYVDNPDTISESGGYLRISVVKTAAKFTCAGSNVFKNFSTQYQGGEVMTYKLFSQAYGRFEVRAKLPQITVPGVQETFWLWPDNPTKYGAYPGSGEIDFAEFYSQYADRYIPYLHYDYNKLTVNTSTNTNIVTNDYTCLIDVTQFHNYVVEWQPGRITLTYDGNTCLIDNYKPSNVASPAPFDQPFFLSLTQALGVGTNSPTASTPLPATTLVDEVRVWK
jgi:beta-glucanase (GH16 family)